MKYWIMTIIEVYPSLVRMTEKIDSKVEKIALSLEGRTLDKVEAIIKLNDAKVSLINLKVLYERIKDKLTDEEFLLLKEISAGQTLRSCAQSAQKSPAALYRKFVKILQKAGRVLTSLGFDDKKMDDVYLRFPYIKAKMLAVKRRSGKFSQTAPAKNLSPLRPEKVLPLPLDDNLSQAGQYSF